MRVVIDTNVVISGLISAAGPSGLILNSWRAGRFELVLSRRLLREYRRVISYPRVVTATKRTRAELDAFSTLLGAHPVLDVLPVGVVRDPDDRHVLGAAIALGAELIVSGDKDLLVLEAFEGIPILTPRQFLDRLDVPDVSGA